MGKIVVYHHDGFGEVVVRLESRSILGVENDLV